jgi:hypothetical protein
VKSKASTSQCSFEFKVWQDAERNTGGDHFGRRHRPRGEDTVSKLADSKRASRAAHRNPSELVQSGDPLVCADTVAGIGDAGPPLSKTPVTVSL